MFLEIHDKEVGNSLAGKVKNIDYDYMAEQWVQEIVSDPTKRSLSLDQFILKDEQGVRAIWKVHENMDAELIERSERFRGEWVLNYRFVPNHV